MRVITLDKAKELLGISDTTYDTELNLAIPIIDAAVKQITRNRYNTQIAGDVVSGSKYVEVRGILYNGYLTWDYKRDYYDESIEEYIEVGQQISGDGIPADTTIEEVYYNGYSFEVSASDTRSIPVVKMSAEATESKNGAQIFLGINTALQPIIAKAVWWQTEQLSTTIKDDSWSSKSMGPVSVTKASGSEKLDGKSGLPLWFVRAFPMYHGGH